MSIKIGSNIASIQAQRRLGEATSSLEKIYQRLSSGRRINSSSDDAAGLAIAEDLNTKVRIYTQAIRNGNDGISVLSIADSGLSSLSQITTRIRELSEQSANGVYSSKQRNAIDAEAQALSKEFTRIVQATSYNGIRLLDGSLGNGLRLQLGLGEEGSINTSVGGATGTGSFNTGTSYLMENTASRAVDLGDLNNDGILDLVTAGTFASNGYATVRLGLGSGVYASATSFDTETRRSDQLELADLNSDGRIDLVTAGIDDFGAAFLTTRLGLGDGSFGVQVSYTTSTTTTDIEIADIDGDNVLDILVSGIDSFSRAGVSIRRGNGDGSFGAATVLTSSTSFGSTNDISLGDVNGDGLLDLIEVGQVYISYGDQDGFTSVRLGTATGTFATANSFVSDSNSTNALELKDINSDGILDLISGGSNDTYQPTVTVRLGSANGSFSTAISVQAVTSSSELAIGDTNGDAILDIITTNRVFLGSGNGQFTAGNTHNALTFELLAEDLNGDRVIDLISVGSFSSDGYAQIQFGEIRDGVAPLLEFSLKTSANALSAMSMLDQALVSISNQRGTIGSYQSRVEVAINSLISASENFKSAEARVVDADVALEAASLLRTQILQQSSSSVLAQANQSPSLALSLLRQV